MFWNLQKQVQSCLDLNGYQCSKSVHFQREQFQLDGKHSIFLFKCHLISQMTF